MATYSKLKRKKGTVHRAQIRLRINGELHTEAKTFSTKPMAKKWAERREAELQDPEATKKAKHGRILLKTLIQDYLTETSHAFGRTKRKTLEAIANYAIGELSIQELTTEALLDHVRWRRETVAPPTAGNDLIWIRGTLEHAKYAWGMDVDVSVVDDASTAARRGRLTGNSKERDRRPTTDEIERLRTWFNRLHVGPGKPSEIPMANIMDFAIASARRQGEITRLLWSDLDAKKGTCLLRDAKSPMGSKGNHRTFALTKQALAIIKRQPRTSDFIFPYEAKTIGTYFTKATSILGIDDLRFHDLRHEATSRLFEAGYQIHEVQQFTLHDQWATLQRYTQLKPENVANR